MMWDAVNLFIVNKIPLFENDLKTWVKRWSYNSNLSLGSGQVNCRNILRKCKQTLEIPEKFEQFITQPDTNNWAISLVNDAANVTCFFLSSNVCQFKFFLSLRYAAPKLQHWRISRVYSNPFVTTIWYCIV